MTVPTIHRFWNERATIKATREHRDLSLWPRDSVPNTKRAPLLVHTGPSGRVNTGGHTS